MSDIQRWEWCEEEIWESDRGEFVSYTDHKAIVDRVCRWTVHNDESITSSCGQTMETWDDDPNPDVNYCWYCGGEVEVCDEYT